MSTLRLWLQMTTALAIFFISLNVGSVVAYHDDHLYYSPPLSPYHDMSPTPPSLTFDHPSVSPSPHPYPPYYYQSSPPPKESPILVRGKKSPPPLRKKSPPPSPSLPKKSPPPSPPPPPVTSFDYFALDDTWPPTFCKVHKCVKTPLPSFTIHGLWPSNNPPLDDPRQCSKDTIDYANLGRVKSDLDKYWPALDYAKTGDDYLFWSTQWSQHGTCSLMTSLDYFDEALKIHKTIDLTGILRKKSIIPSGKPINTLDIVNAIVGVTRHRPQLVCKQIQNQYYLYEIKICLEKSKVLEKSTELKYVDCRRPSGCSNQVYFPI